MHLGQTAAYLAEVMNRPEPTIQIVARRLREFEWVRKGARGRNAPHLNSTELARFLIALMASPDSPALAMERLPHFAALPLDDDRERSGTFATALAMLLDRIAEETWEDVRAKNWGVTLTVDVSAASIWADPDEGSEVAPEEHHFTAMLTADPSAPLRDAFPYHSGLEELRTIRCHTLFRIAKVALADEPDPLDAIAASLLEGSA